LTGLIKRIGGQAGCDRPYRFISKIKKGEGIMKPNVIVINPKDNVAIALDAIKEGEAVKLPDSQEFATVEDIPYSHKIALSDITAGCNIIKYGEIIGEAKEDIKKGQWVHTHNLDIDEKKR
jgi:altronate dehydratase